MSDINVLSLTKNLSGANIPGAVAGIQWGCGACPEFVLGVLVDDCRDTLTRILRVKRLVTLINRFVQAEIAQAVDDLRRLVALVPVPPILNLTDIVGLLTCPLTPQAIAVQQINDLISYVERNKASTGFFPSVAEDVALAGQYTFREGSLLTILDPSEVKKRIAAMISTFVRELHLLVDNFMDALSETNGAVYLRILKQFWDEIRLVTRSADILVVKLAVTKASVALVKATCPSVYDRADLPFSKFNQEASSFSFDGILPSGLSSQAQPICTLLAELEFKILAWQTVPLIML